jgi:histidine triad (HIT) family protein
MAEVINYDKDCLFCNIIKGDIPSTKVYEDEHCFAFRDIAPQAPTHILVVPKMHIASCGEIDAENSAYAAKCLEAVAKIARQEKLEGGFRVISNCGADAGQTVPHLHFHILGGKPMSEHMV